jgi:hypothetical protein
MIARIPISFCSGFHPIDDAALPCTARLVGIVMSVGLFTNIPQCFIFDLS